jgi:hypothetical protein
MIRAMEKAVFKRPISLFLPERVRKLVTPVLGNRPSAVLEAVSAHGPERATKRAGCCFQNGQRAVLGPVLGFSLAVLRAVLGLCAKHSQKRAATRFENGTQPVSKAVFSLARMADKTGWVLFSKRVTARFGTRLGNGVRPF